MPARYACYDALPVGVAAVRGDEVLYVNEAWARLLGRRVEEFVGKSVRELIAAQTEEPHRQFGLRSLDAVEEGGAVPVVIFNRVLHADGHSVELRLQALRSHVPGDVLFVADDGGPDSATRRFAEALTRVADSLVRCREEEAVLEQAVEAIAGKGYTSVLMKLEGEVLRHAAFRLPPVAIAAMERHSGQPLFEHRIPLRAMAWVPGMFETGRAVFHPDMFAIAERVNPQDVAQLVRSTLPVAHGLDAPIRVDGAPFGFLSVQGPDLPETAGPTLELFCRLVGAAIENARHHQQARARLAELTRLQAELLEQSRMSVLREAAAVLSHEARNPLGAIMNALAVLRRGGDQQMSQVLSIAEEEALRLDALVRDLVELSRPLEPKPRALELEAMISNALSRAQARGLGSVTLVRTGEACAARVIGDQVLADLALDNLLRDAVLASPPGAAVEIGVEVRAPYVVIAVQDRGPTLGADRAGSPLEFSRAQGTGVGLAVCRRIAEALEGRFFGTARPGGGARFELSFLLAEP